MTQPALLSGNRYTTVTIHITLRQEARTMTDQEICDLYDSHPMLTLAELARITGKSVAELKKLLMNVKL
jgi:hypothetical protein